MLSWQSTFLRLYRKNNICLKASKASKTAFIPNINKFVDIKDFLQLKTFEFCCFAAKNLTRSLVTFITLNQRWLLYVNLVTLVSKVSLHSWQRVANTPILWSTLYCLPPFLNFDPPPPQKKFPYHLRPPPPPIFLLSCFFGWMGDHATFDLLFYLMITWIYTCWAFVL